MRHFFLSLAAASAALLCGIGTAHAVPAKPGLIQVTQSDGTQLTVRLVGDERRHYMLSSDGYTLTGGPDGDLYYAELSASGKLIPTKVKARPVNALTADEKAVVSRLGKELKPTYVKPMVMPAPQQTQAPVLPAAGKPAPPRRITSAQTTGRLKSLIILVESSDKKFASASAQQDFRNLLMQDGYSVNGATGSAWNYYQDNSNRLFDPEFVVVGPYKASKTSAYYAGSDDSENVAELIVEACRLADNDVNFTDFADNGVIRDVFVFYAGRGQADSGDTNHLAAPVGRPLRRLQRLSGRCTTAGIRLRRRAERRLPDDRHRHVLPRIRPCAGLARLLRHRLLGIGRHRPGAGEFLADVFGQL